MFNQKIEAIKIKLYELLQFRYSKNVLITFIALIIAFIALSSCKNHTEKSNQSIAVSVIKIIPKNTPVTIEFVGQTESAHQVEIRARVNGFFELAP